MLRGWHLGVGASGIRRRSIIIIRVMFGGGLNIRNEMEGTDLACAFTFGQNKVLIGDQRAMELVDGCDFTGYSYPNDVYLVS